MRHFFSIIILVFSFGNRLFVQPVASPQLVLKTTGLVNRPLGAPSYFMVERKDSITLLQPQSSLPLNFYSTHLGTACKMELQLEKQTKLPIRIRLGSKEQVDYLEGKFNRNR